MLDTAPRSGPNLLRVEKNVRRHYYLPKEAQGCTGRGARGSDAPVNISEGEWRSTKCSPSQHQIDIVT